MYTGSSLLYLKLQTMFSLNCPYYTNEFYTAEELGIAAAIAGVDLDEEVLFNGRKTGEILADLVQF
jgi:hypothetical protein